MTVTAPTITVIDPATERELASYADQQRPRVSAVTLTGSERAGAAVAAAAGVDRPGSFFAPTVLTGVEPGMTAFVEETFGPVAAVTRFADDDEAIALANDTTFGLGATVWSRDTAHAWALARRIQSGSVAINAILASDPRLPFGGIKRSGYGRELAGVGLHEFTNIRTCRVVA